MVVRHWLGTELTSSIRAESSLNHGAISGAPDSSQAIRIGGLSSALL